MLTQKRSLIVSWNFWDVEINFVQFENVTFSGDEMDAIDYVFGIIGKMAKIRESLGS